ncbi:hypothetical protein F3J37_01290 [Pantoea sp. Al-1710]|uniref:Co-chaperone DjlA N-terminal domain-containing protein n=1 Tax=Candidatus Pantoea communis TaxID=2608354 RepID=A0ABX0RI81_9GAMM|nr:MULTISPECIES: TerB family tellurite resistance protein [Pantoea]NIG12988.1 hypothetical protein [Pantoea sp. Cy-640]NIG17311.1 hypothetical protein [Pantoea communis]
MDIPAELTLNELIASLKVMYLAVFANGEYNENQKEMLNDIFEAMGLEGDARFVSRKLAERQKAELERDYHSALDNIFYSLEQLPDDKERSHRLMTLYFDIAESDSDMTESEEIIAQELADCLDLDIDYYLRNRTD